MATINAGQRAVAQTVEDVFSTWTDYTPSWTGSVSNPAVGNGTLVGRYKLIGKTCHFTIKLTCGSTTTVGSGLYAFTLPVTASGSLVDTQCPAYYIDNNAAAAGQHFVGVGLIQAGGTTVTRTRVIGGDTATATANNLAHNYPIVGGVQTSDIINISGTYEAA